MKTLTVECSICVTPFNRNDVARSKDCDFNLLWPTDLHVVSRRSVKQRA